MIGLTHRQAKCLLFIEAMLTSRGFAPSLDEIAAHVGLKSKSGVHRILCALEARGFIRRMPRARAIELLKRTSSAKPVYQQQLEFVQALKAPVPLRVKRARVTNIRPLPPATLALLGVALAGEQRGIAVAGEGLPSRGAP